MSFIFKYQIIIVYDNGGVFFNSFSFIEFKFTFLEQHAKKEYMKDAWKMKFYPLKHAVVMIDRYIDVFLN